MSCNKYLPTRVPASSVVRMNNASNMIAKWYQSARPWPRTTFENICDMPTASVAAPPVLPYNDFSPLCDASASISDFCTGKPHAVTFSTVASGAPFMFMLR